MKNTGFFLASASMFLLTACSVSDPLGLTDAIDAGSGTVKTAIQGAKDTAEWTQMTAKQAAAELEEARKKAATIVDGIKKVGEGIKEVASGAGL